MIIKEFNARQVRWVKKLIAFDFDIEYRKNKLNSTNTSSRKLDLMKSNDSENNNNNFLSNLRYKLRNREHQLEFQENYNIFVIVKLAVLTKQSNSTIIANTMIIDQNEKVLDKRRDILNFASFRLLVNRVLKSKKSFMKFRESMIAWSLKL